MTNIKKSLFLGILTGLCMSWSPGMSWAQPKDIVQTAVDAGQFKTLAKALQSAELVETLKGKGPFTVFAPTDAAFAKLPANVLDELLKPENKKELSNVLTYHVVKGQALARQFYNFKRVGTLNGQAIEFQSSLEGIKADDAQIIKTDIVCSNGVIHVVDAVLTPASQDLVQLAKSSKHFNLLLAAAKSAGLVDALAGDQPYTVFAPTDKAFQKIGADGLAILLRPENKDRLAQLLKYHVVPGRVYIENLLQDGQAQTLSRRSLSASVSGTGVMINNTKILEANVPATNGLIHVIDAVLIPMDMSALEARHVLASAVKKGAPVYNAGDKKQCADLYSQACQDVVAAGGSLPDAIVKPLKQAMETADKMDDPAKRAWALRHAIDQAYKELGQ